MSGRGEWGGVLRFEATTAYSSSDSAAGEEQLIHKPTSSSLSLSLSPFLALSRSPILSSATSPGY